jgi:ribosomal protein S18 acetylase RimI-like enzyme
MSELQIRDLVPGDIPALLPLLEALGYPAAPAAVAERLVALRAHDPSARVLVAVAGGRVTGFATLHATPVLHRPTAVGRITGIAVLPESRGTGVGARLVSAAEAHFTALGLERIEVTSGPTHRPAYAFYRRLGYEDQGVRFAKRLLRPGPR